MKQPRRQSKPLDAARTTFKQWKDRRYSVTFTATLDESKFSGLIMLLNENYYNEEEALVEDAVFDKIFHQFQLLYPNNPVAKSHKVRAPLPATKVGRGKNTRLSHWMSSLDKIYPGSQFSNWIIKVPSTTQIVVADKLDGFSLELIYDNEGIPKLITGGDGVYGMDVSHLIPYLDIPQGHKTTAIRLEGISRKSHSEAILKMFKNPRNMLGSVFNSNSPNVEMVKKIRLVALELRKPTGLPLKSQYEKLKQLGFEIPWYKVTTAGKISEAILSNALDLRRTKSHYAIDGLVLTFNRTYTLPVKGNPDYAIAFKVNAEGNLKQVKVVDVVGRISRNQRIVPTVHIEPTELQGVTVSKVTGHNYGFIHQHDVGPGAIIEMTRSGEVIPYIVRVVKPAKEPKMPDGEEGVDWKWSTEVDVSVIINDPSQERAATVQALVYFCTVMGIQNCKQSTVSKLYDAGVNTPRKILAVTPNKLRTIEGLGEKTASSLYQNIVLVRNSGTTIPRLATGLAAFGVGIGYGKLTSLCEQVDLEHLAALPIKARIDAIAICRGFSPASAEAIAKGLPNLFRFIAASKITIIKDSKPAATSSLMADERIVFTGFRSSELTDIIQTNGGQVVGSMTNATRLLSKTADPKGVKTDAANKKGLPIQTVQEFLKEFGLSAYVDAV